LSVTLGTTSFDHIEYDANADVLYLHVGDPSTAVDFDESPEGHALRFDADGVLVGVTIVGARELVGRREPLVVTVPSHLEINPYELEALVSRS
jgi:uncharacterized protein YuzE